MRLIYGKAKFMAEAPIPQYGFEQAKPVDAIATALGRHGWAAYATTFEGVTHLYAARRQGSPDVDADTLRAQLKLPPEVLQAHERLVVDTAGEGSLFEGRTFVDYTGRDQDYFDYIIGGLVAFGEQAAVAIRQSRLRKLEAMGMASGLAALGLVYALLHRK